MRTVLQQANALLVAFALVFLPSASAEAQVFLGAHGTITQVGSRDAYGVGGQVGYVFSSWTNFTLAVEGSGEYLWPSCDFADCGAFGLGLNFVGRQRVSSFGELYGGVGVVYQDVTAESDDLEVTGDDVGLNILLGTQAGSRGGLRPFVEVDYAFMKEFSSKLGIRFGLRFPI